MILWLRPHAHKSVCLHHPLQCEFPVIYASGFQGIAGNSPKELAPDMEPLFQVGHGAARTLRSADVQPEYTVYKFRACFVLWGWLALQ
jgi:hypothetical protein